MTEPEAAEVLRVCPRTLRKARDDGRLTYILIGRAIRYTKEDLDAFIDISRQETQKCRPTIRRTRRKTAKVIPFSARN